MLYLKFWNIIFVCKLLVWTVIAQTKFSHWPLLCRGEGSLHRSWKFIEYYLFILHT